VTLAAVVLALAAATCFALTSALQQRAAKQERRHLTLDPRLLLRLLHRPLWLAGWAPDLAGVGLQALALRFGPISLVQPLLISGILLAIPLEAALDRRLPHVRDLVAVAVSAASLTLFLAAAQPRAGVPDPSPRGWLGATLGSATVLTACVMFARVSSDSVRGTLLGIGTGAVYGLAVALLKVSITTLTRDPLALLTDWHLYALIPVGITGLVLNQDAFQNGPLAAPLTALTLTDPAASVIIGLTAFHEQLSVNGPRLAVELAATVAMVTGVWLASTGRTGRTPGRPARPSGGQGS
jgi:hypothetical protein